MSEEQRYTADEWREAMQQASGISTHLNLYAATVDHLVDLAESYLDGQGRREEQNENRCSCSPHPIFGHQDSCRYVGMGLLKR